MVAGADQRSGRRRGGWGGVSSASMPRPPGHEDEGRAAQQTAAMPAALERDGLARTGAREVHRRPSCSTHRRCSTLHPELEARVVVVTRFWVIGVVGSVGGVVGPVGGVVGSVGGVVGSVGGVVVGGAVVGGVVVVVVVCGGLHAFQVPPSLYGRARVVDLHRPRVVVGLVPGIARVEARR